MGRKVKINLVDGSSGYSLQITDKEGSGYRLAGPKAWGNPYNKPTASFEVNVKELLDCVMHNSYYVENNKQELNTTNNIFIDGDRTIINTDYFLQLLKHNETRKDALQFMYNNDFFNEDEIKQSNYKYLLTILREEN